MRLSLAADANCIDVGANIGDILQDIVTIAPNGRHVAYEPLPELGADLKRRFPKVDVRNAAVSDADGEATFYHVRSSHGRSSLSSDGLDPRNVEQLRVRLEVLDEALPREYVPALVKIDVEGAEAAVLRGARRLLGEHHPIVVFEHGAAAAGMGSTSGEIHGTLGSLGFRIFDIDGRGPLSADEFDTSVRLGKVWTYVAHV